MAHVEIKEGQSIFLDYGCGKGRAVILAATYSFLKVIGVEKSQELCAIAKQNIGKASSKLLCKNIEIICVDATIYTLPPEVTIIFLWNPFTGKVLAKVIDQIKNSLDKSPRNMTFAYFLPFEDKDLLSECDWLTQKCEVQPSFWTGIRIILYENKV